MMSVIACRSRPCSPDYCAQEEEELPHHPQHHQAYSACGGSTTATASPAVRFIHWGSKVKRKTHTQGELHHLNAAAPWACFLSGKLCVGTRRGGKGERGGVAARFQRHPHTTLVALLTQALTHIRDIRMHEQQLIISYPYYNLPTHRVSAWRTACWPSHSPSLLLLGVARDDNPLLAPWMRTSCAQWPP